ncbi:MAG: amidase family protein [Pantoea sp.]|uniref:amidase n=1 Tax=Pantoea sp. TaxID=69393 RepID=UPI00239CB17B|nr:amidase family protein [Pantoea sp.]MDE1186613.1 amidase family protein [Pantoea sp.]
MQVMPDLLSAAAQIRQGEYSSVALVEFCLQQIKNHNPTLNAFGDVYYQQALAEAEICDRESQQGKLRGPLHGVPFGIKDLFSTAGLRTCKGSLTAVDNVPDSDAPIIARLKAAGAIIIGKTATTEFGWTGSSYSRVYGHGRNPWDPSLTSGGSSSGSAISVAARMVPAALGSDGGGSVRIPGAFCGIFALKASLGRIPTWPWSATEMLSHAGPMTRTVRDSALLFDLLSGPDARDHQALPAKTESWLERCDAPLPPLRVHYSPTLFNTPVDARIAACVEQAVEQMAHALPITLTAKPLSWQSPFDTFDTLWSGGRGIAYGAALRQQLDQLDPGFAALIERAQRIGLADYLDAQKQRAVFASQVHALFDEVDLLITPTLPILPFAADRHVPQGQPEGDSGVEWARWTPFTWPFNLSGNPAATVPCGFTPEGLPVGLQVIGRRYAEGDVLQFCAALEALMPWDQHLPSLSPRDL